MKLAVALFATMMLAAPAFADETPLVAKYDEVVLKEIVTGLGYKVVDLSPGSKGQPSMTVEMPDDLAFQIQGASCDGDGKAQVCEGVQLAAVLGDAGKHDPDDLIAEINRTYRPGKLFAISQGLAFERYLIMDGGVSKENLSSNVETFAEMLKALWKKVHEGPK